MVREEGNSPSTGSSPVPQSNYSNAPRAENSESDLSDSHLYDFESRSAPVYTSDEQNDNEEGPTLTFNESVEKAGFGLFQIKLLILCGTVWMADSMEMMLLSLFMPVVKEEWGLEDWEEALVPSVVFASMLVGSSVWGKLSDHIGRRWTYLIVGGFTTVFGFVSAFSPSYVWLVVTRGLVGFGIGGAHVAFSMFAEFLPVKRRGAYMIAIEYFWTIGAILEAVMAWATLPNLEYGWRWLLGLSAVPLLICMAWYPLLPESPHFLIVSGKSDKAWDVIRKAAKQNRQKDFPHHGRLIEDEEVSNANRGSLKDLLGNKAMAYLSIVLWLIWFSDTFVYYGLVFFTPQYFKSDNENSEYLAVFLTSIAEVPGLFCSALIINRLGRKITLFILFTVGAIFTFLLAIPDLPTVAGTIFAIVSRAAIMGAFSTTYVYTPEAYPTTVRSTALGISNGVSRAAGIITPYVSSVLKDVTGAGSVWLPLVIYGVFGIFSAICSILLPVETNNKALPQTTQKKPTDYSKVKEPDNV
eukprot:gb/GECH01012531.1/.p1 GENE.gb/GECH01012531.1/~~gb/GECH01012531.1/.p1  ORF type:complete len:525 (+),score=60.83 gb/GECH01012531.1/:1-1575(+)